MSKKFEAIKKAVFYSEQKPELLANILTGLVDDKASSVSIDGAGSIVIPKSGNNTEDYTASVLSQFGDTMEGAVTLELKEAVTGVTLSDGKVTVASTATAESFVLKATSDALSAEKVVTLTAEE